MSTGIVLAWVVAVVWLTWASVGAVRALWRLAVLHVEDVERQTLYRLSHPSDPFARWQRPDRSR